MHWQKLPPIIRLLLCVLLVTAQAHSESDTDDSSTPTSVHSATDIDPRSTGQSHLFHSPKTTSTAKGGIAPFKTATHTRSHLPFHTATPTASALVSNPFPHPTRTHPPQDGQTSHRPSGWSIFLEVFGALLGLGLLAALARCFWSYRNTPRYRHTRLESIMEIRRELVENRRRRSTQSYRPPPPPYRNPPSYEVIQAEPTLISTRVSLDAPSIPLPTHQLVSTSEPLRPPGHRSPSPLDHLFNYS